jgi:hypothetical protein
MYVGAEVLAEKVESVGVNVAVIARRAVTVGFQLQVAIKLG